MHTSDTHAASLEAKLTIMSQLSQEESFGDFIDLSPSLVMCLFGSFRFTLYVCLKYGRWYSAIGLLLLARSSNGLPLLVTTTSYYLVINQLVLARCSLLALVARLVVGIQLLYCYYF
jgi:hypothetical protein